VRAETVSFHKLDGFALAEFSDGAFDFVFSHDVFVHLPALQVYSYLGEIRRVLKPGGLGLISFLPFVGQFGWFKELSLDYFRQRRVPPPMRHYFVTEEMLRTMLADLSLVLREVRSEHYLIVVFQK
jgi:SAM-dependent methyltransferase